LKPNRNRQVRNSVSQRMRVLFVSNQYSPAVQLQVEGLRAMGVDVFLLVSNRAKQGRCTYMRLPFLLKGQILAIRPDIVHVQFGGVQAAIAAYLIQNGCLITFHGTDLHGGTRTTTLVSGLSQRIGVWCSRFAAKRAAWNILVSKNLCSYLPNGVSNVSVIPTGVNFDCFKPMDRKQCLAELKIDPKTKWVLFSDYNYDPIKRRDIANAVVDKTRSLGYPSCLLELHQVDHDLVPLYLNAASALLLTSDKEGSPNIVKEALACNIPVVSVDVGDVKSRLGNIVGCHVCAQDVDELASALCNVLEGPGRCEAREKVRDDINNIKICEKIIKIYERIL